MKKRKYQPKRITLISLLIRAFSVVLILTLAFAIGCNAYLKNTINQQAHEQISEQSSRMLRLINSIETKSEPQYQIQDINFKMALYTNYNIWIEDPLSFDPGQSAVQIISGYSDGCYAVAALVGEDNSIVASNRQILMSHILFSEDDHPDTGWYVCDDKMLQIPEVDKLYADFRELTQDQGMFELHMTSAYVNKELHTFIPHEASITLYPDADDNDPIVSIPDDTREIVHEISITTEKDGYELMDMHSASEHKYPRSHFFNFYGAEPEAFEQFPDFTYPENDSTGEYGVDRDIDVYYRSESVYLDGKPCNLKIRFAVNSSDPQVRRMFWKYTILFTVLVTVIALLWCWRKNVLNKTKYAFENYQRDLTDHLAHDIKTPLMAISGYAENIQNGDLSKAEQEKFLNAILDNVTFTDSLISRTLFLNHIDEKKARKLETIQAESLVEGVVQKYELLLDEKNIIYRISGSASLHGDRTSLETILENLISNAVKYTSENGSITITLDKKQMIVTNTVAQKISTQELKRPFVRGDEARSNVKGNGLGLSIAERAALTNGYKLSISCTDTEFKAKLRF